MAAGVGDGSEAGAGQIAICHDYLTQRGGAERAVLSLSDAFPGAPIHTSVFTPDTTFAEFGTRDVRASRANAVPALRSHFRAALPLYPSIFSNLRIDAELTICSSSGWAHGAAATGKKIVYCHAPARWLYQTDTYLETFPGAVRRLFPLLRPSLLRWDRRAAATADLYLANSRRTRDMIRDAYGIDAEVLPPPHSIEGDGPLLPLEGQEPGFHLLMSRLLAYKNVGEVVEAFRELPDERLLVVGEGPMAEQLAAACPPNVALLGHVSDDELRWLYANAAALVAVAYEDLGLTPVEAALFGTPTVALRFGGYLDTVIEGVNGLFVDDASPRAIADGVRLAARRSFDAAPIMQTADRYDRGRFEARLHDIVAEQLGEPMPAPVPDHTVIDLRDGVVIDLTDDVAIDLTDGDPATRPAVA